MAELEDCTEDGAVQGAGSEEEGVVSSGPQLRAGLQPAKRPGRRKSEPLLISINLTEASTGNQWLRLGDREAVPED